MHSEQSLQLFGNVVCNILQTSHFGLRFCFIEGKKLKENDYAICCLSGRNSKLRFDQIHSPFRSCGSLVSVATGHISF